MINFFKKGEDCTIISIFIDRYEKFTGRKAEKINE